MSNKINKINKRTIIITVLLCLLPILYGIINYDKMPERVAIHFDSYNQPDGWAPKSLAVLLPLPLALLQGFLCIVSDRKMENSKANRKIMNISKFIVPVVTIFVYISTINIALGQNIDIRKNACILIGFIFVIIGNYLPKTKQNIIVGVKTCQTIRDEKKWAKMNKLMGIVFIVSGFLICISGFMEPLISIIFIGLFITITIGITIYASLY